MFRIEICCGSVCIFQSLHQINGQTDGLLHEVEPKRLDVRLVKRALDPVQSASVDPKEKRSAHLDISAHQTCLADLRVAHHADFEHDTVRHMHFSLSSTRLLSCARTNLFFSSAPSLLL